MKMVDNDAPTLDQARRALDLALVGRDLEVGQSARAKLIDFAAKTVEQDGFSETYTALGALLDRSEVRQSIEQDNSADPKTKPAVAPINRTLTELAMAAKRGDAAALVDLNARMAMTR